MSDGGRWSRGSSPPGLRRRVAGRISPRPAEQQIQQPPNCRNDRRRWTYSSGGSSTLTEVVFVSNITCPRRELEGPSSLPQLSENPGGGTTFSEIGKREESRKFEESSPSASPLVSCWPKTQIVRTWLVSPISHTSVGPGCIGTSSGHSKGSVLGTVSRPDMLSELSSTPASSFKIGDPSCSTCAVGCGCSRANALDELCPTHPELFVELVVHSVP
ncbi:hypothetical protein Salat_0874200, partial [Sesamum alatum]